MTNFLSILLMFFKKHKKLSFLISFLALILVYILLVTLPYTNQGDVSNSTKDSFNMSDYYSDTTSCDRASILFDNEDALIERLRIINNANDTITLSTFDFHADNSGKLMLASLYASAKRGVKVNILIDGMSYFTNFQNRSYFTALGSLDNVTIKIYNPINFLKPHKLMARMHDKYLIVDNSTYILGGRNTYDYFLGNDTNYKNYDWDILVYNTDKDNIANSSIKQIKDYFNSVWNLEDSKVKCDSVSMFNKSKVNTATYDLENIYNNSITSNPTWYEIVDYEDITVATNNIKLISNPINSSIKEPTLLYNMTELMLHSNADIDLHTPYIICNDYMTHRLKLICDNNQFTLMTNSIANNGNPFGATDYKLRKEELINTGLDILEYDSGISYHGKCFTIGDRITSIGSFNLDMRSAYLDTELMLVIDSEALNSLMKDYMQEYEKDALVVLSKDSYKLKDNQTLLALTPKRNLRIKLITPFNWILRYLM